MVPNHLEAIPQLFAYSTGQQMLREMSWEDLEDSVIDIIDRTVNKEGGDFDPERDIHDWKINRWSYGYAHELTSTFDPSMYGPNPVSRRWPARQPFRNVAHRQLRLGGIRLHPQRDQRGLPGGAGPAGPVSRETAE